MINLTLEFVGFFLPAASFLNAALCWSICVWILNKSPKRHLLCGFLFRSIHSPPFYACMSWLILVCNFACDLCCFIVNVYSVKSSLELMLYCFIMCRIKINFSYLILSYLIFISLLTNYQKGRVRILLICFTLPHLCNCPKSGPVFPTPYVVFVLCFIWELVVCFVDIGGIVDHHC